MMPETMRTMASGRIARYGEMMAASGIRPTMAMTRTKKLDARPNCSKKNLGRKVNRLYLVVEMALVQKVAALTSRL